jgi:hypothetical protein
MRGASIPFSLPHAASLVEGRIEVKGESNDDTDQDHFSYLIQR